MPVQVLINIFIAILWMFFQDNFSPLTFFSGYLTGLFILFIMRRYFHTPFYLITFINVIRLIMLIIKELIVSGVIVAGQILQPKISMTPGIFEVHTELETEAEVTLLSVLITLTPGSVVVEVSPDLKILYVHALDIPYSKDLVYESKARYEKAIMRVTR